MNKKRFVLTRKNQKGQVAIFVALIFQVVFVFFAILINVGLLVHHKINLQQSTDLAAYYGAMKQADIMNMISHVNFQMRQAWKLLTWRYRVVGTFGFQDWSTGPQLTFPLNISLAAAPTRYDATSETNKCPAPNDVGILDVPFFCAGHNGFSDWLGTNENNCRINCASVNEARTFIDAIPTQTNPYGNGYTGGVIGSVNTALNQANSNIADLCEKLGPKSFTLLSRYIMSYGQEVREKKKMIQMLGADLSAPTDKAVDLEGGLIKKGVQKTLENNLTEANLTGKTTFEVLNGLANSECAFDGNANDGTGARSQFLTQIKLPLVEFFVHNCIGIQTSTKDFIPVSLYDGANFNKINPKLVKNLTPAQITQVENALLPTEYIVGYEKNPWCQVYYGVKAQSEPKIPFLPIAKIKLSAISFAKPFGGSMGPRHKAIWSSGSPQSDSGNTVDPNLPVRSLTAINPALSGLKQYMAVLPNFSNFVGDTKGLKDSLYVATYQDILLHRQLSASLADLNISTNKAAGGPAGIVNITKATTWPGTPNWILLSNPDDPKYDYLASNDDGTTNSYLRDLEISVLAPNQFDLTYYSIDPDYNNNYYKKLMGFAAGPLNFNESLSKIKAAAAGFGPDVKEVKMDYGFNASMSGTSKDFSVRHQMAVAAKIIKTTSHLAQGFPKIVKEALKFLPDSPSSLLTGWTFQNFSSYGTFPSVGPDTVNTMTFGKCNDLGWNHTGDADVKKQYDSPVSSNLPPTPGNCVWGGRSGYSVKIVSPSLVRRGAPVQPLGGSGTNGQPANPADDGFFTF